ncbi:MAG TPA: hypothetical protein P5077_02920 [bacterium]|nr:hypothetical protein [bacterium]
MIKYLILLAPLAVMALFIACGEEKTTNDGDTVLPDGDVTDVTCERDGVTYHIGDTIQIDQCNQCECEENGKFLCTKILCDDDTLTEDTAPVDEIVLTDADVVAPLYTLVDVAFTDLLEGTPGGLPFEEKRYEVFRDETAFGLFFTSLDLGMDTPVVDFDKDMVIALYNGMWPSLRPIYQLDGIKKLVPDDPDDIHRNVLFVYTTTHYYSEHLDAGQLFYSPLQLIRVEKADLVNFNDRFVIERSY